MGRRKNVLCSSTAGNRADCGGKAPSEGEHPVNGYAGQAGGNRVLGGGAHGKAQRREAEEGEQGQKQPQGDDDHADLMRADEARAEERELGKWRGKGLDGVAPDGAGHGVEDGEDADEDHNDGEQRGVVKRP